MAAHREDEGTHFLNVDLEIYSRRSLKPLVAHLGRKVIVLYEGKERGRYVAKLELAKRTKGADATVKGLCFLITSLPREIRETWDHATRRDFSVGIQAGAEPPFCDFIIESETVQAVAELRGRFVHTIYPLR